MTDVFLSYARQERKRVEPIKSALEEIGLRTFFDVLGIDAGDAFPDVIDKAVREAGVVLGCWTPQSLQRDWVKIECLIAMERKTLIPIELETVTSLDVPAAFFALHRVSLVDWSGEPEHEGWLSVVRAIGRKLKRPEIFDRAKARATLGERNTADREFDPVRMNALWEEWARLSHSSSRDDLGKLAASGEGTAVGSLAHVRMETLAVPPSARVWDSGSIGQMPPRGWTRIRSLAPRAIGAIAIVASGGALVYFRPAAATTPVPPASSSVARPTLEEEVGPYLASLEPAKLSPFFAGNPFARDGMLAGRKYLADAQINTPLRLGHFLAQVSLESAGFTRLAEKIPEDVANSRYANRMGNGDQASGDGYRYRGRGIIQITGRANYESMGKQLGVDLLGNPDLAADPRIAIGVAAFYWRLKNINRYADANDLAGVTRSLVGGGRGLADRTSEFSRACTVLDCLSSQAKPPS